MPQKKKEESDTAIAKATIELPATDVVKVEKNLSELGFFTPSSKAIKGGKAKTINFTRVVEGRKKEGRVTIAPVAIYGLPVTADQDKYFALQKIITDIRQEFGAVKNPVSFSSAEILNLLGKGDAGKNYREILEWLKRMTSTTIISEGVVFLAGKKKWAQDAFHVFDRSVAVGQELPNGDIAEKNYVWLSEWQLENINNNYLLPVDFETYKNLKSHIAKALVPLLQIWLFASAERGRFEKRYDELCQHLNISQCKQISRIKERLGPALDELKSHSYISKWKIERTSDKKSFKVVFYHGEKFHRDRRQRFGQGDGGGLGQTSRPRPVEAKEESEEAKEPETTPEERALLDRLIAHGVTEAIAKDLVANCRESVERELESFAHRRLEGVENPAGLLVAAIRSGGYSQPSKVEAQRAKRAVEKKVVEKSRLDETRERYRQKFLPQYLKRATEELSRIEREYPEAWSDFSEFVRKDRERAERENLSDLQVQEVIVFQADWFFNSDFYWQKYGIPFTGFWEWDEKENPDRYDPA